MTLVWEDITVTGSNALYGAARAKVPGGWLIVIKVPDGGGVTFYPDPDHEWDGNSLP